MFAFLEKNYLGLILSIGVGLMAHFLSPYIFDISGVILAFIFAVVIGNFIKIPDNFQEGIGFTSAKMLEFSIIFLAFSISFQSIAALGATKFVFIAIIILIILFLSIYLAKAFGSKNSTAWLVGFGTAICGSSAIAAVAPAISKNKEDAGIAIAVVNLLGSVGMVVLPYTLYYFFQNEQNIGFVLGASLQSVANVAGAGYGLNENIGDAAILVKMARVALLSPAVILFSYLVNKNESQATGKKIPFSLPYYLWIFIGITLLTSFVEIPKEILSFTKSTREYVVNL
jgi:uncharacterized integral membrane protein (TIGR00698 family)